MVTRVLDLNLKTDFEVHNRLFVEDHQVLELCLGLSLLRFELIDILQLSEASPLRLLKLTDKQRKKWKLRHDNAAYAVKSGKYVDLRLSESIIEDWLKFYLKYHYFDWRSNVDHDDWWCHAIQENKESLYVTITFTGAGYTG